MDISKLEFERFVFDLVGRRSGPRAPDVAALDERGEFDLTATPYWQGRQLADSAPGAARMQTVGHESVRVHASAGFVDRTPPTAFRSPAMRAEPEFR